MIILIIFIWLVQGILKGFDQLNNLVLEQAVEEKGTTYIFFDV